MKWKDIAAVFVITTSIALALLLLAFLLQ